MKTFASTLYLVCGICIVAIGVAFPGFTVPQSLTLIIIGSGLAYMGMRL